MDYIVHEVAKSWTRLTDFHFYFTRGITAKHRTLREGGRLGEM